MKIDSKAKKYGLIAATALLLVLSVYLNYRMNNTEDIPGENGGINIESMSSDPQDEQVNAGVDYFSAFRENREEVRAKEIEYLNVIIEDDRTDAETLADAQQQMMALVDGMEKELTLESLLRAKGFDDVAVTLHQGSVNVIVDSPTLSSEQVAQILDIVIRETGETAQNIKVAGKS